MDKVYRGCFVKYCTKAAPPGTVKQKGKKKLLSVLDAKESFRVAIPGFLYKEILKRTSEEEMKDFHRSGTAQKPENYLLNNSFTCKGGYIISLLRDNKQENFSVSNKSTVALYVEL